MKYEPMAFANKNLTNLESSESSLCGGLSTTMFITSFESNTLSIP